jgi:hypothetical protein
MAACLCLQAESAFMKTKSDRWASDETVLVHGTVGSEAFSAMDRRRSRPIMQTEFIRWKNRDAFMLNSESIHVVVKEGLNAI